MFIIKSKTSAHVVTLKSIAGRVVNLGFDTDNLVACFQTRREADIALNEDESANYQYRHSLAMGQQDLYVAVIN